MGKEGEGKMQSVKYEPCCLQRTKNHNKFKKLPSEIVNPNIKLRYLGGLKQSLIKPKCKA